MLNKIYLKLLHGGSERIAHQAQTLRHRCIAASLLSAVVLADPAIAEELNSERIERRYGSYGVQILEEGAAIRVSSLGTQSSTGTICRTLALVQYSDEPQPDSLQAAHREILGGASIGATLKTAGWQVTKSSRHVGEINATAADSRVLKLMHLDGPQTLALHIYDLEVRRGSDHFAYATLLEIHHPDYLPESELKRLYPDFTQQPLPKDDLAQLLALARLKMKGPTPERAAILLNL